MPSAREAAAEKRHSSTADVFVDLQPTKLEWTPVPEGGQKPESASQRSRPTTPRYLRECRIEGAEAQTETAPRTPRVAAARQEVRARTVPDAELHEERTGFELQELAARIRRAHVHVSAEDPWWCRVLDVRYSTVTERILETTRRSLALKLHPDKVSKNIAGRDLIIQAYHAVDEAYNLGKLHLQEFGEFKRLDTFNWCCRKFGICETPDGSAWPCSISGICETRDCTACVLDWSGICVIPAREPKYTTEITLPGDGGSWLMIMVCVDCRKTVITPPGMGISQSCGPI
ncbi:unnamed protein product, partial [Symbiodinium necroappetens]